MRALHEAAAAIYLMLNRAPTRAIAHLADSLRIDPESFEAHYNLATALVRQRGLDEAADHFQQALRITPDLAAVPSTWESCLRAQNHLDAATEHLPACAWQLDRATPRHTPTSAAPLRSPMRLRSPGRQSAAGTGSRWQTFRTCSER